MYDCAGHGSLLQGFLAGRHRLWKAKKIEILENGRRIYLLHDAPARAQGISPFGFARRLYENRTSACCIHAMPALSALHHHGPRTSLSLTNWRAPQRQLPIVLYTDKGRYREVNIKASEIESERGSKSVAAG